MIRLEAIEIVAKNIEDQPIIAANGFISRDLFESCDKESNFYMIGSMGLSSSIGLGIAIKNPKTRVNVFDGDGNILMNLGSLATIGSVKPKNFVHFVFDNEAHESTGSQPTISSSINIEKIAHAAKYHVFKTKSKQGLIKILEKTKKIQGPIMIIIKIDLSEYKSKRVSYSPSKIRERVSKSLSRK